TVPFERMYLRASGIPLPKLGSGGGAELAGMFKEHMENLSKTPIDPSSLYFVKYTFDDPSAKYSVAQFGGKGTPTIYALETVNEKTEALYGLSHQYQMAIKELANNWFPTTISEQPVGRTRKEF